MVPSMARLLITGGTGSFGGDMARRLLKRDAFSEIVVFSRDEKKQHDMRHEIPDPRLSFVVGDVRDREAVMNAMRGIDYVFHAAALKHVPTGESFPMEVVRTNILGTENVFAAARAQGVRKVVLLSTDKAVYPINAMGGSKFLAEKLVGAYGRESGGPVYCAVRYGNVMASRGSVIPLFIEQILARKPITITNPEMTRFLLSLDDALDLVEFALAHGQPGEMFIRKAPAATVEDIALALKSIFNSKSSIKIVGVRAGEKIHETLATAYELSRATDHGDYYAIPAEIVRGYDRPFESGPDVEIPADYTSNKTRRLDTKETERLLRKLPYVKAALKSGTKK